MNMKIIRFDTDNAETNQMNMDYVYIFMYKNFCDMSSIINGFDIHDCSYDYKIYTDFRKLAIFCDQDEQIEIAMKKGMYNQFQTYYKQLFEYSSGKYISENDLSDRLEKLNEIVDIEELIEEMRESILDNFDDYEYFDIDQLSDAFILHSLSNWMYDMISGNSNCFIGKYAKQQIEHILKRIDDSKILELITYKDELIDLGNNEYNVKLIKPKNKQRRNG